MENDYEFVNDIASGNFSVAKLMRNKSTHELFAMKLIPRGHRIDDKVAREIVNHRSLRHPNIVRFKELVLTPTHLAIVMEYAAGGELFDVICNKGVFNETQARYFFRQLILGVSYCHSLEICHRDLKLENLLLDGSQRPLLKICDFGYSKSSVLQSRPKSTVGTPAYIAPEVFSQEAYDGKLADIWSCGVILYTMLVGSYPFQDPKDTNNYRKTIQRILSAQYSIPEGVYLSEDCRRLISRIFVVDRSKRITMSEIKNHPWFLKNVQNGATEDEKAFRDKKDDNEDPTGPVQSVHEIMKIISEARIPPPGFECIQKEEGNDKTVEEFREAVKKLHADGYHSS